MCRRDLFWEEGRAGFGEMWTRREDWRGKVGGEEETRIEEEDEVAADHSALVTVTRERDHLPSS